MFIIVLVNADDSNKTIEDEFILRKKFIVSSSKLLNCILLNEIANVLAI